MPAGELPNEGKRDPENYRQMLEPFSTSEAADATLKEFFERVYAIRNELGITDVVLVIRDNIVDPESAGGEIPFMTMHTMGDYFKAQSMLAWAFGKCQADEKHRIMAILAEASKSS